MDAIAAMLPTLMVVKLSEQLGTGPAEPIAWILCRPKKSAENFNNAITRFFRRPDVAFTMCVLSALVPLGYLLVAYLRWKRWYP